MTCLIVSARVRVLLGQLKLYPKVACQPDQLSDGDGVMPIFTVDGEGVHAPSLETALITVRQQFADLFGEELANADQTPQGQLAGIIAVLQARYR